MRVAEDDSVGLLPVEKVPHLSTRRASVEDMAKYELEAAEFEYLDDRAMVSL